MSAGFENISSIKYDDPVSKRTWLIFTTLEFDFHVKTPLFQYRRENGDVIWLCDRNGKTDFASTPPPMWGVPCFAPWRFRYSATVHDQGYLHHWLYINGSKVFVTREYMDELLEEMIEHEPEPGNKLEAWLYYRGVKLGGRLCWGKGDDPVPPLGRIDVTKLPVALA